MCTYSYIWLIPNLDLHRAHRAILETPQAHNARHRPLPLFPHLLPLPCPPNIKGSLPNSITQMISPLAHPAPPPLPKPTVTAHRVTKHQPNASLSPPPSLFFLPRRFNSMSLVHPFRPNLNAPFSLPLSPLFGPLRVLFPLTLLLHLLKEYLSLPPHLLPRPRVLSECSLLYRPFQKPGFHSPIGHSILPPLCL